MSESTPHLSGLTLNSGFTIARFVVGEEITRLAHELDTLTREDPAVEIRWPYEEKDNNGRIDSRVNAKLIKQRDIRRLPLINDHVPLARLYEELDIEMPELHEPITEARLTEVYETPSDRGGNRFIAASFDTDTGNHLAYERDYIMRRVARVGGMREDGFYQRFVPDTTLVYLGRNCLTGSVESAFDIISAHLPLPVQLDPAVRSPQIDLKNN